ncbi:MAG TPA: acyl-CoA dehydrogenase family protein [Solirubrobacteraceae bacterium]|nr:acyl-CoA dehydrogenase family protein [Solirubrobacteraceae bacterium]
MDFDLTEDQREIKNVARELLSARSPLAKVREAAEAAEYDDALWREIVQLGWPGIAVAEQHGGQGLGAVELAVLLEELGYACAATPFLSTAVAAAVIQAGGTDEQRRRWLPGLIAGETRAGVGSPDLVVDGAGADVVVLLDDDGARLVSAPESEPLVAIDPTRRFATVRGEGEALGADAADRVRTAVAAEVVGVCQRALEMTLDYVKERKQFGVAVGSFQAVSHRCAQMLLHTESTRSAAYYAAWAADAEPARLGEAAALAAAAGATGAREVPASAIQAHGGIGFTWEADVHWLYKRGEVDRALLGGAKRHHAALARAAAQRLAVPAS